MTWTMSIQRKVLTISSLLWFSTSPLQSNTALGMFVPLLTRFTELLRGVYSSLDMARREYFGLEAIFRCLFKKGGL